MTEPAGYTALSFEEIDGPKRRVLLKGTEAPAGHPMSGTSAFRLGGKVRTTRTYEAGPEPPTRHTTNTEENDIEITCTLRDRLSGRVGGALETMELIDAIRKESRLLRIHWGKILRRGVLVEFNPEIEGAGDIICHLRFEIDDEGENTLGFRFRRRQPSLPVSLGAISDDLQALKTIRVDIPTLDVGIGAAILELYGAAARQLDALIALAASFETGVGDSIEAVGTAVNAAGALLGRLKDLGAFVGSLTGDSVISIDDAAARANWFRKRTEAELALARAVAQTIQIGVALEQKRRGLTSGRIYTVGAGDTVESIAASAGCTAEAIRALNPDLPVGFLAVGTRVRLP